jgi:hypothetical protein
MKGTRCLSVAALLAGPMLGCTRETGSGPVQWTASDPSSARGQTDAQAWSRSTSRDKVEPAGEMPTVLCEPPPPVPLGVTNAMPPAPPWLYSGVTLRLVPR